MSSILFAGLGSVGSKCAESVVRTTLEPHAPILLERVVLLDRDVLELANLTRHEALPHEVNQPKVELVANRLRALAPALAVETAHASVFDTGVEALVAGVDLVAASFDNPPALFRLNALCARHRKPLLVVEVISGGIGVWLLAANTEPGGPCLLDIARARHEDVQVAEVGEDKGAIDYADPSAPVAPARVPADDWSCSLAAALLTREIVRAARAGTVSPETPPIRLIALERVEDPAIGGFFEAPLQVTVVAAPRIAECPECSSVAAPSESEHAANLAFFTPEEA